MSREPRAGALVNRRVPCCFSRYVRIAWRTAFAVVNNLYCIPSYVLWMMALRLVRTLYAPLYWKIEGLMFHWLLAMVSLWSWTAGYEIVESGDEPATCYGRRTLVLANHQSTADVPILMSAWNPRAGVLPNLMWIMDHVFKFTNFGIVSVLHQDFFIRAIVHVSRAIKCLIVPPKRTRKKEKNKGRDKRDQSLEELRQHIHQYYLPLGRQFMVLFPEGGFLHKRREVSQRFAAKNNLPKLEYVSLPRVGAMRVIMEEVGPHAPRQDQPCTSKDNNFNQNSKTIPDSKSEHDNDCIEWILDITIAYEKRIPLHLVDIVCGIRPPCTTHLHYRLYPSTDVPQDVEGMTQWLYDRFIEKDRMLETFYSSGEFPGREGIPNVVRTVRQDNVRYLILHLFFIVSTLVQLRLIWWLYECLW